jgi:hypothetical protein
MPFRNKAAKAAYDRRRREAKRVEFAAYDAKRNAERRADPAYAAAQVERKRRWRAANRERHLATSRAHDRRCYAENLQRRLSKNLRARLRKAMLGLNRGVSAVRDLGCSIPDLRAYLEAKFLPGMTWENYGEWHVDHARPLKEFDLADQSQARAACHHSNLQPLWARDNQRKWCKPQGGA